MKKLIAPFLLAASLLTPAASFAQQYSPDSFQSMNQSLYNPNAKKFWDEAQFSRPSEEARSNEFSHTVRYYINQNNQLIRIANISSLDSSNQNKYQMELVGFMNTQINEDSLSVVWSIKNGNLVKTYGQPFNETVAIAGPRN